MGMGRETKRKLNNLSLRDIPGTQKYLNAIVPNKATKKNKGHFPISEKKML